MMTGPAVADSLDADARTGDLVVATYNVHRCIGTDGRQDVERVAAVIQELGADIVGLQEVMSRGSDPDEDQLARLACLSGLHAVAGPVPTRSDMRCGNGLLCRSAPQRTRLLDLTIGRREPRGAIEADVEVRGWRCRVIVTHFGHRGRERRRQEKALIAAIRSGPSARLTVILGDLNEWLRPRRLLGALRGFGGKVVRSFPTPWPVLALDRVLVCPASAVAETRAHASALARTASDHLPVRAVLVPSSVG